MNNIIFFKDRPLFGLDIGADCLRVIQVNQESGKPVVSGFGSVTFDPNFIKNGVIVDPVGLAKAADELFNSRIQGSINSRRVAIAIPAARTFSRAIKLPVLKQDEVNDAVRMEAEQYIPIPIQDLYLDYDLIRRDPKEVELFAVAAPKQIVDSYITLSRLLGLEVVTIETSIDAAARLFRQTNDGNTQSPTVLVDFGPSSADITIVDKTIIATGTVGGGGDNFTARISNQLGVTEQEAHVIKTKYGLNFSKKQQEISDALGPILDQLFREIRRMIRYYEERYGENHKISQIVLMGGGANVPGLSDRMTDVLRLPVRTSDPWHQFAFETPESLRPDEHVTYITAAGLALIRPTELFR